MDKKYWLTVAFCSVLVLGYWIGYYHRDHFTLYHYVVYSYKDSVTDETHSLTHGGISDKPFDIFGTDVQLKVTVLHGRSDNGFNTQYRKATTVEQHHNSRVNNIRSRLLLDGQTTIVHRNNVFKVDRDYSRFYKQLHNIPPETFILQTKQLPDNARYYPSVANGHLGTVIHSSKVFMNGVYNGAFTETHRAAIPTTCSVVVNKTSSAASSNRTYQLNLGEGVYSEQLESADYQITQRLYAHRTLNRLLVVEIEVVKMSSLLALNVVLGLNKWTKSDDITFVQKDSGIADVIYQHGTTNIPERNDSATTDVHVYYDSIPDVLTLSKGETSKTWVFLTSISDTQTEAQDFYQKGEAMLRSGLLYSSHVDAWTDIWSNGVIYAEGNLMLAQTIIAGYYYILSSVPRVEDTTWPYVGISPTGLPTGDSEDDYRGHVFWDQDTWQYPPVLFLHSDFAENMISNRKRIAAVAKIMSKAYGFKGLKFPWEAAFTGYEVSPSSDCRDYEVHVNGDISQSIVQYFHATNNTKLLPDYAQVVAGIADFWVSRMVYNESRKKYEIKHVLPADEDAGPVDNNVYTSVIAQVSIENAQDLYQQLGKPTDQWTQIKDNIYVPFDEYLQFHPEYTGYPFIGTGIIVKQADVVLLGYPLNRNLSDTVKKNDLSFYAQVTKDTGPAMTWSIISINWLDLGEVDKGHSYFERNFGNVKGDFKVWSEVAAGWGAANFLTGIGGFLQNVINGYGGFRLYKNKLAFNPTLPRNTTALYFKDIDYLGSHLDFTVSVDKVSIELVNNGSSTTPLCVYCKTIGQKYVLKLNAVLSLPRVSGVIMPLESCNMAN